MLESSDGLASGENEISVLHLYAFVPSLICLSGRAFL